jgi:hypothetical protein
MEWDKNITSLNIYCIVPLFQSIYPCPKYVLKLSVSSIFPLGIGEGSQDSNPWSFLCVPGWQIGAALSNCHVLIRNDWPWTIVGSVFGECHAPFMLMSSFVDFEKE